MNKKYLKECEQCKIDLKTKKNLCPYCITQKVFKGKWKLLIYWHLQNKTLRFGELSRLIPSTQATLIKQLKELEDDGIINRKVYNVIPPKVEYSLTELGKKFLNVGKEMFIWGNLYIEKIVTPTKNELEEKV